MIGDLKGVWGVEGLGFKGGLGFGDVLGSWVGWVFQIARRENVCHVLMEQEPPTAPAGARRLGAWVRAEQLAFTKGTERERERASESESESESGRDARGDVFVFVCLRNNLFTYLVNDSCMLLLVVSFAYVVILH